MPAQDPQPGAIRAATELLSVPLRCPKCGQDLAGLEGTSVCPACWTAFSVTKTVADDRPCLQCGYNLRGLPESGSCPECGAGVARSLLGNLLVYSSREHVAQLVNGAKLVFWSIALAIISGIGGAILAPALARAGSAGGLVYLFPLIRLVTSVMGLAGWWLLSAPDPGSSRDTAVGARKVLRIALIVSAGCVLADIVFRYGFGVAGSFQWFGRGAGAAPPSVSTAVAALAIAASLLSQGAWLVKFFASMAYLRTLAPRIPDPKVHRRAKVLIWFAGVMGLVVVLGFAAMLIAISVATSAAGGAGAPPGMGATWALVMPAVCVCAIAWLVFLVMYVGLVDRVKKQLNLVLRAIEAEGDPGPIPERPSSA